MVNIRNMPNLFFPVGGGNEIGASCYFVQLNGTKFLLDAGIRLHTDSIYPRFHSLYVENLLDGLWELDGILLSHGHIDHIGSLPFVVEEAQDVPIYATLPTREIVDLQLNQSLTSPTFKHAELVDFPRVKEFNALRVQRAIENITPIEWHSPITCETCQITFFPAGHILGASMVYIESDAGNILFTGDFTPFDQLTVPKYQLPDDLDVDLLITESTYGYQESPYVADIDEEREHFAQKIDRCLDRGGTVLIPAFAIGRSQEVALILRNLIRNGRLKPFTIYIDGLARVACDIYQDNGVQLFGHELGKAPQDFIDALDAFNGVIIASSGMLLDNSMSARYAEKLLPDPRNAIFFSGYLDEESPGRKLERLHESKGQHFRINERDVPVHADVDTYRLSAHTGSEGILSLIERVTPKKVIFVHGCPQYKTAVNIHRETCRRFQNRIEVYQANNGMPIYF
jgi:Cft2 family RNA processing exonuclease